MKAKELIEKLNKCDKEKEVVIRFAVVDDDEIGYVLLPKTVDEYYDQIALYSDYPHNKEGCDFMGQVDLATAYRNECPNMTADEMFEEVGYKKHEHNTQKPKEGEWVTQDEPYIQYIDEKITDGTYYSMFIMFMTRNKLVQIGGYERGTTPYGKRYERVRNPILNTKEVQAINQKCKELGWLE